MAVNFKIKAYKIGDELHLNLMGDFDGSSAWELLNDMAEKGDDRTRRIIINTNGLGEVHPFGRLILQNQMPLTIRLNKKVVFLGRHVDKIVDHSTTVLQ